MVKRNLVGKVEVEITGVRRFEFLPWPTRTLRKSMLLAPYTVAEAVTHIRMELRKRRPAIEISEPFFLNGKQVQADEKTVLRKGDTLRVTDP